MYTIMKNLLASIITLLIFNNSFAQKSESELLKIMNSMLRKT
ncbi:hypothetical protein JCM19302_3195 [Jejuia pallidilutea]|uniref:Uncharacterized protein n=1 Tax=Jejuia pallidilutea TaxID=504487 RepID=A0A090W8Y5_9FLAO|nr:hypothetical protein JCM19302_3195 [Jejuia pallidilutea]